MRQGQLTAPAVRFLRQPVEPFQAELSPALGCALDVTAEHVERTADTDAGAAPGFLQMLGEPILLLRKAHSGEQQLRAALPNLAGDARRFFRREVAVACTRDA